MSFWEYGKANVNVFYRQVSVHTIKSRMKELSQIYREIFADHSKWKYYSKMNTNPFETDYDTKQFITRFIELSGKAEDNPLYENINKLEDIRISHIVSTFFLGTYLYNHVKPIKNSIDKVITRFKKQNPYSKIEFSFIWFLICLFHDLGYSIEDHEDYTDFDDFINGKVKYFLRERVGVPSFYEDVYKNYFNYRLNSKNNFIKKPDHGICGGIVLFNELNKILLRKQKQKDIKSEGLSWNKKLLNIYRYASWVILSHNIFFIRKGDVDESIYMDNKLDALILKEGQSSKIDLKKYGFLYLFMLVDTIDPIKKVKTFENLGKIKCKVESNLITLEIEDENIRIDYYKKVLELKEWLISDIKVVNKRLEIKIE